MQNEQQTNKPSLTLIVNEDYVPSEKKEQLSWIEYIEQNPDLEVYMIAFGNLMIKIMANMYTMRLSDFKNYVKTYLYPSEETNPVDAECIKALRYLCSTNKERNSEVLPESLLSEALTYRAYLVGRMFS